MIFYCIKESFLFKDSICGIFSCKRKAELFLNKLKRKKFHHYYIDTIDILLHNSIYLSYWIRKDLK